MESKKQKTSILEQYPSLKIRENYSNIVNINLEYEMTNLQEEMMSTIKYGMTYWKKYLGYAIFAQLCGFMAIAADLMIPLLSQILIDYIILDTDVEKSKDGIFYFLLSGKYG